MGQLIDGEWVEGSATIQRSTPAGRPDDGQFRRRASQWRHVVEDSEGAVFPLESDRYRLYVAWACPWAHRTLLARTLLGLEHLLPVTWVAPEMLDEGWVFGPDHPDTGNGLSRLSELYVLDSPRATTRVTVPVLWDGVQNKVVNNESAEIVRMFNRTLVRRQRPDALLAGHDLRPAALVDELDAVNRRVYDTVNNGVYRCGFARTQSAYDQAVEALFASLDWLEARLQDRRWLVGGRFTEADLRLFPTLVRFDPVYHHHFKCSLRRLRDYPALWAYTRDIYQLPGVTQTLNLAETRQHYFRSHTSINPLGIVPIAPAMELDAPHARAQLGGLRGD